MQLRQEAVAVIRLIESGRQSIDSIVLLQLLCAVHSVFEYEPFARLHFTGRLALESSLENQREYIFFFFS